MKDYYHNNDLNLEFSVRQKIEIENLEIILLDIPYNDDTVDNIYGIHNQKILWRVQTRNDLSNKLPYEQMTIDTNANVIAATDFYGRRSFIDEKTGKIIKTDTVK